jgi:hypothetical protein
MPDTPIENRFPWLLLGAEGPKLPENPTRDDFAKAYADMLMVYQAQRQEIVRAMEAHREERREVLEILKTIRRQQTGPMPMPTWAKVHSVVLVAQALTIGWLFLAVQRLVERLAAFH